MPADRWGSKLRPRLPVAVLAVYTLLTVVMTYPQAFRLASGARDWGDPLLNAWIMWWEVDAVARGNLAGFFDANIFFPHYRTLAYSEFLVPQALVAAPLLLLFENPLVAYNVVLLAAFVATAFATYVLGRHLTGSPLAGFVSGLAMAFSPFMFSHLSHLQVISAAGIPLAFYFLHRYFDEGSLRTLLGFSVAYIGQSLANAYYAVYLTYAAGAYIVYRFIRDRRAAEPSFYGHMAIHSLLSIALIGPFFVQYFILRRELGFVREMAFEGGWYSFLAAPPINRMYGELTRPLHAGEAALFPGFCVVLLAVVGLLASRSAAVVDTPGGGRSRTHAGLPDAAAALPTGVLWTYRLAAVAIVVEWLVIVAITLTGGIETNIAGFSLRATEFRNPLVGLVLAISVRALLRHRFPGIGRGTSWLQEPQRFYGCMLFAVALLTLGPDGPYRLLYAFAPGFDGIRAVPRIHILTVFCLAVFVAYGTRATADWLRRRSRTWVVALIPIVMLVEFFSAPVPMFRVRWGEDAPAVYGWLAEQEEDFAVVEYPIDDQLEFSRLFYSTAHRKKLVNGMSGYPSPTYTVMRSRMWDFPSARTIADLRALGVRWVIVHPQRYLDAWADFEPRFIGHADDLRRVAEVDGALVFELRDADWLTREEFHARRRARRAGAIPSGDWTATASINDHLAGLAVDGEPGTRWSTDLQRPGDYFQVDFGSAVAFDGIVMHLDSHPRDYPRGYRVEVSDDARDWRAVAEDGDVYLTVPQAVERRVEIDVPMTRARHLRIVQTGQDPVYWWSIHELEVLLRGRSSD